MEPRDLDEFAILHAHASLVDDAHRDTLRSAKHYLRQEAMERMVAAEKYAEARHKPATLADEKPDVDPD